MADKKTKKILIFACPRTGTTIIQKIVAKNLFGLPNLVEPYNDPELGFNPGNPKTVDGQPADLYQWTADQITGVIKLLAINLPYIDVDKLLWVGNFDRILIIQRRNLTDCCVSLLLAEATSKYHYFENDPVDIAPFTCDMDQVDIWIDMYKQYSTALEQIKNSNTAYDTIYYEDFMNDQVQYIAGVPLQRSTASNGLFKDNKMIALNLLYQDLCVNYYEVEEKIRKELC